ncbi:hypothetical protein FRB99_006677 [Tulasnella sp. 403]|nr:hypothetical protein FRB99_006677 [Tulasnella sp. 403]
MELFALSRVPHRISTRDTQVSQPIFDFSNLISVELLEQCIHFARNYYEQAQSSQAAITTAISPTSTESSDFSSLGFHGDVISSATSYAPDPHAVSKAEAQSYYAGLLSEPTLIYRTGKDQWTPPTGPEAQRRLKELRPVFAHPICKVWNDDLGWKVVAILDTHKVLFTTIDVVRFKMVDDEKGPTSGLSVTAAHDASQDLLALLKDYDLTDVDIHYRESNYIREAGPQLFEPVEDLDPTVDVVGPLTPALGLRISTKSRPQAQGTMALYLAEGGGSDRLLGLSCRHVLFGSNEANVDYVRHHSRPRKDVLLLGTRAFNNLVDSIKLRIGRYGISVKRYRKQIEGFVAREAGTNPVDVEKARANRIETQGFVDNAEKAMEALAKLLDCVKKEWSQLDKRVIGHILRSPAISLGVGPHRFTEDWGIFVVDRSKLGDGFQGNKIDLGTKIPFDVFTLKCFPRGDADWEFEYPVDRLLPLMGVISDELMRNPDMFDGDGEPCLLVIKSGNATGTTIGRANGLFSITRDYFPVDQTVHQTSMEWGIINYDSKSEVFSEPGDSGSVIVDIRGGIGGMLTGSSGKTEGSDMTYATPFWWLLGRIRANGFPNAHLNVVA